MSALAPDVNSALAGDLFSEADLSTGFQTDVVEDAEYVLALSARFNKKDGGIIFVEGKVQAGIHAGKNLKVFSAVLDSNTAKRGNQKGVALTNLAAIGLTTEVLNNTARQVGAVAGNLEPLYQAVTALIEGRVVNASMVQNSYTGKNGAVTEMQVKIGAMSLVSAPAGVAIGGAPVIAAPAPAVAVAAPPVAPLPVAAPPVAPPPVAVPVAAPPVAPAPVAAAPVAEAPALVPVAAAPAPVPVPLPVAEAPAPVAAPLAVAPPVAPPVAEVAPPAVAPVAVAPAPAPVAPAPGTVSVAPEPSF